MIHELLAGALLLAQPQLRHGLNPSFHGPSSRAIVFADAFLRARVVDPVGTRLFSDVEHPGGRWVLEWDGPSEDVSIEGAAPASRVPGRSEYVLPRSWRPLYVRWSGETGRIHLWLPGTEGELFWPPFVRLLRAFRPSVLRTLDWTRVNEGLRPRDPRTQWVVSASNQVALANLVGCDLHYQVPHDAPEAWLRATFAELRALDGELTVEVSNELWNPDFPVWRWLDAQPGRHVDAAARELDRVLAIAAEELPQARRFVGGQLRNPWYLATLLDLLTVPVDACGPAAYVGPRGPPPATAEDCALACLAAVPEIADLLAAHRAIAQARGLELEVYEAGQSFKEGGPAVSAAQRLELMGGAYRALARVLEGEGVARVCWYSLATSQEAPGTAPFGLLEGMSAPLLPKAAAVLELARGR